MTTLIAALPMYDAPELRAETDAQWAAIRDRLRAAGIDAPEELVRRNADMPPVPGGILGRGGKMIAPDPATLPPDEFDLATLWRHPALLFGQTCWGPMELGLADDVLLVAQPDYSAFEGGQGRYYASAIVTRKGEFAPASPSSGIPIETLRGRRLAFNSMDSMSGLIALKRDLALLGEGLGIFSAHVETGAHRASVRAVAEGRADVAAIDCRTWQISRRFDSASQALEVVGWTGRRKGLPYIMARPLAALLPRVREALAASGTAAILG